MCALRSSETASIAFSEAVAWAELRGLDMGSFSRALVSTVARPVRAIRLRRQIVARRFAPEVAIADSRRAFHLPQEEPTDPWSIIPAQLKARTLSVVVCFRCHGSCQIVCIDCGGSLEAPCSACHGSGRAISPKTGRSIQCRSCRGRGLRHCRRCQAGEHPCVLCEGTGRIERWLKIVEETSERKVVAGEPAIVERIEKNDLASVRVLTFWAGPPSDAPAEIRNLLQHPDLAISLIENERIARAHVEVFGAEEVTYRFQQFGRSGDLKVIEGLAEVAASPAAGEALSRRSTILGAATWLPLLAGGFFVGLFASRHTFYAHSPKTPLLAVLVLLIAFAIRSLARELAPPSARRRVKRLTIFGAFGLLLIMASATVASTSSPSIQDARKLAEKGDTRAALDELVACIDLGYDAEPSRVLADELRIGEVAQADPAAAWNLTTQRFDTGSGRKRAAQLALSRTTDAARSAFEKGQLEAGWKLLETVPQGLRSRTAFEESSTAGHRAEIAAASRAVDSAPDLPTQLQLCSRASLHIETLHSKIDDEEASQFARRCKTFVSEQQRQEKKARADLARRERNERLERERDERSRAAGLKTWANAPLLCNDGALSPSCVCGGSHRGCCSHHGGVAGCSRNYPN